MIKWLLTGWVMGGLVFSGYAQGSQKKLDSLYLELDKHTAEDTNRVLLLSRICLIEQVGTNEKNKALAEESLALSQKLNYDKGIGLSLRNLAQHYRVIGDYDQAAKYAYWMATAMEHTTQYKLYGQSYTLLGIIFESAGDLKKAEEYELKALDIFQQHHRLRDVGYAQDNLGSLYRSMDKLELAEKYHQQALDLRLKEKDTIALIQSYAQIALVYKRRKQYEKAILSIKKSMELQEKIRLLDNSFLTANYNNLGEIYYLMGRFNEAEPLLIKAAEYARLSRNKMNSISAYETLVQMEEARGNYKQAMRYLTLRDQYKDSVFTETKDREYAKMQALFETTKKNQTIKELENEQAAQRLKQWLLIGGILIILAASLVIYLLQRAHNKKTNDLLQTQHQLNEQLKENDQMKSRFFANISHEFRTPLSLIISPVEDKLRAGSVTEEDKGFLKLVSRNARQLLNLVNQLLDLTKLEAGKMELIVKKGDLAEWFHVLMASFDSLAESKKINFTKSISLTEQENWFDAGKVEMIVNNILFNAFKFTPAQGTVSFSVTQEEATGKLTIRVSDTGPGIPAREQQYLFTPFHQATNLNDDQHRGTGLGLSLVKELVTLYHGHLHFESTEGKGTTFTITLLTRVEELAHAKIIDLPADTTTLLSHIHSHESVPVEEDDESLEEAEHLKAETVLIIEDNADLRKFIASTLGGYSVLTASDGEEGFGLAAEHIPDLIISDVMMPKMNGIALAEKIKSDERTSHIPVILLTAKADLESRLEGLKTGADDYLAKPFSTEELSIRVHNLIDQRKKLAEKFKSSFGVAPATAVTSAPAPKVHSLDDRFLEKARQVVEANIDNPQFGVEQFAESMNLSRAQLFRKLKAIIGMSPNEFINDLRLQRAAEMIKAKTDTVSQIAYSVGFSEQSYFAKRFKKKFGVTPSVFATTK
jgi:signal transduction histidine kinase/DNA-binding response OmpR family regulator